MNRESKEILIKVGVFMCLIFLPIYLNYSYFALFTGLIGIGCLVKESRIQKLSFFQKAYILYFVYFLFQYLFIEWNGGAFERLLLMMGPFFVTYISINKKRFNYILLTFYVTLLLTDIYCWSSILYEIISLEKSWHLLLENTYTHHNLSEIVNMHSAYLGLLQVFGFLIGLDLFRKNTLSNRVFIGIGNMIFLLFLLHLVARSAIIAFIGGISFIVLYELIRRRKYLQIVVMLVLFSTSSIFVYNHLSEGKYHFQRYLRAVIPKMDEEGNISIQDKRIGRWYNIAKEIPSNDWVLGNGINKSEEILLQVYKKNNDKIAFDRVYNAHNQILTTLLRDGFIGLLLLSLLMYWNIKESIKKKNIIYLSLYIVLLIGWIGESMLLRVKGVEIFVFIQCVVFVKNKLIENGEKANLH